MKLKLYKTISKHNVINKTLTDLKEIDIKLKNSESFETPKILLSDKNISDYNYAEIPFFKRFYFIEENKKIGNNLTQLMLSTDVLETYKQDILKITGTINGTNTSDYSNSSNDVLVTTDVKKYESTVTLPDVKSTILVTIGG